MLLFTFSFLLLADDKTWDEQFVVMLAHGLKFGLWLPDSALEVVIL